MIYYLKFLAAQRYEIFSRIARIVTFVVEVSTTVRNPENKRGLILICVSYAFVSRMKKEEFPDRFIKQYSFSLSVCIKL
jgi:hypothetical protein